MSQLLTRAPVTDSCARASRTRRSQKRQPQREMKPPTKKQPTIIKKLWRWTKQIERHATTRWPDGRQYWLNSNFFGRFMVKKFGLIFSVISIAVAVTVVPAASPAIAPPTGEDDFQLVKVADGVYAAIAKSGG